MKTQAQQLVRKEELAALLKAVRGATPDCFVIEGPSGVGKTTLLTAFYEECKKDSQLFPIYCSTLSKETLVCTLARIENAVAAHLTRVVRSKGEFGPSLNRRIKRAFKVTTFDRSKPPDPRSGTEDLYQVSLVDRVIYPRADISYRISKAEAKIDFFNTLKCAASLIREDQKLVLIVDSDSAIRPDVYEVLTSTNGEVGKVVIATEITDGERTKLSKRTGSFLLHSLSSWSQTQTEELVSTLKPQAPESFARELWERLHGHPLLTDASLKEIDSDTPSPVLKTFNDSLAQMRELNAELYSGITDHSTIRVIEALAILHDGGHVELLADLTAIPADEIFTITQNEDLISTETPTEHTVEDVFNLYHPTFKEQVELMMADDARSHLRRGVGLYYLNALLKESPTISLGAAIATPQYFVGLDQELFIDSVLLTLPLALLAGDVTTTTSYVELALSFSRNNDNGRESPLLNALSVLSYAVGDVERAISYGMESLAAVRRASKPNFLIMSILSNLAFLLQLKGDLTQALQYALESTSISHQLSLDYDFRHGIPANLSNVGLIYEKLGDLGNALRYYEQAYRMDHRQHNLPGAASSLRKIGAVLVDLGKYEDAIKRHTEALSFDEQMNDRYGVASDQGNLGVAYYQNGDYEKSLYWLKKAFVSFKEINAINEASQIQQLIKQISDITSTQT